MQEGTKVKGTPIVLPQLAESLVSATIGKWLKKPGDYVEKYEVLCELITDKVNADMPSSEEGILTEILVEEGTEVQVGTPICVIAQKDAEASAAQLAGHGQAPSAAAAPEGSRASIGEGAASAGEDTSMRHRYSPAVRSLADENGIDLRQVPGTGMGGRITRKDVLRFIAEGGADSASGAACMGAAVAGQAARAAAAEGHAGPGNAADVSRAAAKPADAAVPVRSTGLHLSENPSIPRIEVEGQELQGRGEYFIDVTPIRNTIATRMRQSVAEIPHAWTMIEVDVTNLVLLRNKLKNEFMRQEGINLTYLSFLMKAVVSAIKDYPIMNSIWAVDKIIVKRDINISLAVGTEDFVVTPVIRKADQKNIAGLAREIDEYTRKARSGKLNLQDLQGGTFTVNNTGSFGSILSYPIINYPQAAILTFESIVKKPVVIQDMIAVRSMVNLCLSLDHRILDGVICGRFLQRVKENLEGYNEDTKLY